ncbi:putative UPF0481 protein At3g02645 [Nicotiana tabacum]|uniref:UPF0481 protein At3g02645 n=1 Tax=Nicotiana tabacum TaxID=4097 RepID=A0A1S4AMU0_TOBAC|nr:putative UPF0481 protein At3g02645 [Nicotiana tomentosiformis]XP_016477753.1 PREDICTED: putative UPF0481 protein At3g02645 [Nicotiana tabacum]
MSSCPTNMASNSSTSNFDERRWVIQIRRTLDEELEEDTEIPVSIYNVPKSLMVSDPDSYVPQLVAIGPYHYWRPELYDMERYKLSAAKTTQKHLQGLKFQQLVEQLIKFDHRIRCSYHKYLNFSGETLAWMMAVDASFLLEFLQIYATNEGKLITKVSSRMSHLVDVAGRKSTHNAILRDIIMLENQIPLFLLRKMLEFQFSSLDFSDNTLLSMLMGFCKELSPFKMVKEFPKFQLTECAHMLDFLYQFIVPKLERTCEITEDDHDQTDVNRGENSSFAKSISHVGQVFRGVWKILLKINRGPVRLLKRIVFSRPVKLIFKLPWKLLSSLPGIKLFAQPIAYMCFSEEKAEENPEKESESNINKPPLVEEIAIPSVTKLTKAGVSFVATNSGIMSINFDGKKMKFYLPTVSLDINTETILRNLVAYEACNASGPLVFTRYTELMNGIIDTEEDAALLREKGIILNRLKRDAEVANLWNGMSKSVRLTKVPFLDKVIEDVNGFYNRRWKVKIVKIMKHYVFGSWQFLTFMACIMFLFLTTLQAFCSVYKCARIFNIQNSGD